MRRCALATFGLFLTTAGCGPDADPERVWQGSIEVREGVAYVNNSGEPLWGPANSGFVGLVLEQTFGSDVDEDSMLGRPTGIAADSDGNVYVVDAADDRLLAFQPDGQVLWTAGQNGEGPGELNRADQIVVSGPDELTVSEFQGRLQRWTTSGEYVDRFDLPVQFAYFVGLLENGPVMATSIRGTEGARVSTLRPLPEPEMAHEFDVVMKRIEGERPATIVAGACIARDQFVFGSTHGYRVAFHSLSGELRRVVTRPAEHLPGVVRVPDAWTVWGWAHCPYPVGADRWLIVTHGPRMTSADANRAFESIRRGEEVEITWRTTLELLDHEGRLLALEYVDSTTAGRTDAWFGTLRHLAPGATLYTVADDPFPQVRRYRLEITPPAGAE